jgi:hypothetical protein
MSDQLHQAKAVRVQSSAIVVAAVITTCGAVASALIQTGLTGKSTSSAASGSATFAASRRAACRREYAGFADATDVFYAGAGRGGRNAGAGASPSNYPHEMDDRQT